MSQDQNLYAHSASSKQACLPPVPSILHGSYMYVVPTNGACFGPQQSDAPDFGVTRTQVQSPILPPALFRVKLFGSLSYPGAA